MVPETLRAWKHALSFDRYGVYLSQFDPSSVKNAPDRKKIERLTEKTARARKHLRFYIYARYLFLVLLYASVALPFLSDYPFLSKYGEALVDLSSFVGASVLTIILLGLTKMIGSRKDDLAVTTAHILAIYTHNDIFPDARTIRG